MRNRLGQPSNWIMAGLLLLTWSMILFSIVSLSTSAGLDLPGRPTIAAFIAVCIVFVVLPSVGAMLAILRPANPIGWLFLVCGFGFTFSTFTTEYVERSIYVGALPGAVLVDWVGSWIGVASVGVALIWIPLLFPDGHLPGPRWRPVAYAAGIFVVSGAVAQAVLPDGPDGPAGYGGRLANPIGLDGPIGEIAAFMATLYFPVMGVMGVLSLLSLVVRFTRSRDAERRQLKWFLFAVVFLLAAFLVAIVSQSETAWYAVILGLAALPVAAAIAILRYRLYDIDRLVSRTIAYAVVTGGLVVVYLLVNLGLTTAFSSLTRVDSVAVAASTLVVAALFTPIRRRVQRVVDRHFDRARYDGDQTAQAFSSRLRDEVDLPAVTADLDATVRAAIAPSVVGIWLRSDSS